MLPGAALPQSPDSPLVYGCTASQVFVPTLAQQHNLSLGTIPESAIAYMRWAHPDPEVAAGYAEPQIDNRWVPGRGVGIQLARGGGLLLEAQAGDTPYVSLSQVVPPHKGVRGHTLLGLAGRACRTAQHA